MHPRTRLVYFYFMRVNFLLKTSTSGLCDQVRLPWQRYICRSKYGCFCLFPKVTYLHTKNEGVLKFFISNFASLSWRIALKLPIKKFRTRLTSRGYPNNLVNKIISEVKFEQRKNALTQTQKAHNFIHQLPCLKYSNGKMASNTKPATTKRDIQGSSLDLL